MNILQITVIIVVSMGVGDDQFHGGMVVASIYSASRIVVKPINCEFTSILDNTIHCIVENIVI